MCGGTRICTITSTPLRGLSPRVRGNRRSAPDTAVAPRSIPACAGEPTSYRRQACIRRVYPRVCGGTFCAPAHDHSAEGLSPRVRGNPLQTVERAHGRRSIPACAGEPYCASVSVASQRVYPRVCGGTDIKRVFRDLEKGLSPRVRGNRLLRCCECANHRSIPACAGEPYGPTPRHGLCGVYPRVCGEPTLRWQRRE